MEKISKGILWLVPTPVGNLEDITLRAIRILKESDLILAEDTRTTGHLLKHLEIHKPMWSYHSHNEHKTVVSLVEKIQMGAKVALVSDAGTPGISDPGFLLVRECLKEEVEVMCLPGPTAFVPALVMSGLPSDSFVFEGFLPQKKGRMTKIASLREESRTMIFYESPFRIVKTLEQLVQAFGGERQASISREISKLFEETVRGSLTELVQHFKIKEPKGEFVLVVAGLEKS